MAPREEGHHVRKCIEKLGKVIQIDEDQIQQYLGPDFVTEILFPICVQLSPIPLWPIPI
jgi:hypothetical protein